MEWFTAIGIGFLGSFHCIGMCGPIALALPPADSRQVFIVGRLLYNAGRIVTYTLLGALFGALGGAVQLFGAQQGLSIAVGVAMIAGFILPALLPARWRNKLLVFASAIPGITMLRKYTARLFRSKSIWSLGAIGVLNGFLPCGFVYVGIAGSLLAGGIWQGMAYMALFGAGTTPLMFATSTIGSVMGRTAQQRIRTWAIPVAAVALGSLFVVRGLALDIPYISPPVTTPAAAVEGECCH